MHVSFGGFIGFKSPSSSDDFGPSPGRLTLGGLNPWETRYSPGNASQNS